MSKQVVDFVRKFGPTYKDRAANPASGYPCIKMVYQSGDSAPQYIDVTDTRTYNLPYVNYGSTWAALQVGLSQDGTSWRYHLPLTPTNTRWTPYGIASEYASYMDANGSVVCVVDFSNVWRSTDYGFTFERVYAGEPNVRNVHCEPNYVWHVGGDIWFAAGYGNEFQGVGDPLFNSVSSILIFGRHSNAGWWGDEPYGATVVGDFLPVTWTAVGTFMIGAFDYHGLAGNFDGAGAVSTTTTSAFAFGAGDFTIEGQLNNDLTGGVQTIVSQRSSSDANNYWAINLTADYKINFKAVSAGVTIIDVTTTNPVLSWIYNWKVFVVQRTAGVTEIRLGSGIETLTGTDTGAPMPTISHTVHYGYGDETGLTPFVGGMKGMRVTKVARYAPETAGTGAGAPFSVDYPLSTYIEAISEWLRSDDNGASWTPCSPEGLPSILDAVSLGRTASAPYYNELDAMFMVGCVTGPGEFVIGSVFMPPRYLRDNVTSSGWDVDNYNYCLYHTNDYAQTFTQIKDIHEGAAGDMPTDHTDLEAWPAMMKLPDGRIISMTMDEFGDKGAGHFNGKLYVTDNNWATYQRGYVANMPGTGVTSSVTEQNTVAASASRYQIGWSASGLIFPLKATYPKHGTATPFDLNAIFGGVSTTYRDAVVAAAPVMYFRLNEETGATTLADEMGNFDTPVPALQQIKTAGYPGAIFGDSTSTVSLVVDGEALVIPGSSAVTIRSIEFWYNWITPNVYSWIGWNRNDQPLLARGSWEIRGGKMHSPVYDTPATTGVLPTSTNVDRGWCHIVYNFETDGGGVGVPRVVIYVNGVASTQINQSFGSFNNGNPIRLLSGHGLGYDTADLAASGYGPGSEIMGGQGALYTNVCRMPVYGEIAIYDRELTPVEITSHYTLGVAL